MYGMKTNLERRAFFKKAVGFTAAFVLVSRLGGFISTAEAAKKEAAKKDVPLPAGEQAVSEADPVASAIGLKISPKKGEAKPGQACNNCQLFTKVNDGWGHCQLLLGKGAVANASWCRSWSKKA